MRKTNKLMKKVTKNLLVAFAALLLAAGMSSTVYAATFRITSSSDEDPVVGTQAVAVSGFKASGTFSPEMNYTVKSLKNTGRIYSEIDEKKTIIGYKCIAQVSRYLGIGSIGKSYGELITTNVNGTGKTFQFILSAIPEEGTTASTSVTVSNVYIEY